MQERVAESAAALVAIVKPKPVPKGGCPKCGKKIGKGIAMHRKHCKG